MVSTFHSVNVTPGDGSKLASLMFGGYVMLSAKYPSAATHARRRSALAVASNALSFELANLGIAIVASSPIRTTTMSSSISVKPRRPSDLVCPARVPRPLASSQASCENRIVTNLSKEVR